MTLSKDMIYLTAGLFVLIAAVGTTYYISQGDNAYYCQAENTVGICFKLSAVNSNGLQTRCYYNESAPRKYNYCKSGWIIYKNITVTGKLINISNDYSIQKNGDQYEIWKKVKSFTYEQALDKYKKDMEIKNKLTNEIDNLNKNYIDKCISFCPLDYQNELEQDKKMGMNEVFTNYSDFFQFCSSRCELDLENRLINLNNKLNKSTIEINLLKRLI